MTPQIEGHQKQKNYIKKIIASRSRPHALLFVGVNGIGKSAVAVESIAAFFCTASESPCRECPSCRQVFSFSHPDFLILEPDEKGSIPIGDKDKKEEGSVRSLLSSLNEKPFGGKRAVLIKEIDCAKTAGMNALLKTIEEPSENTLIIMTTSSESRILRTILSRSSVIRFSPLPFDSIIKLLGDIPEADKEFIAAASGGSMEIAIKFSSEKEREELKNFASGIRKAFLSNSLIEPGHLSAMSGKDGYSLIDGAINIYSYLLKNKLTGKVSFSSFLNDLYIDADKTLHNIIKMLLSAKKGSSRNLNPAFTVKALSCDFLAEKLI